MSIDNDTWICPLGLVHRVIRWATVCGNSFYRGPTQRVRSDRKVTCLRCIARESALRRELMEAEEREEFDDDE